MIDKGIFYGQPLPHLNKNVGATYSVAEPTDLNLGIARLWIVNMTGGNDAKLPPANGLKAGRLGGPTFAVINLGSSFNLKDDGGAVLKVVAANKAVICCLVDNSTADGTWHVHLQDVE